MSDQGMPPNCERSRTTPRRKKNKYMYFVGAPLKTPMALLNEVCQKNGSVTPTYIVEEVGSPRGFKCVVTVNSNNSGSGVGPTKKGAKNDAARALLTSLDPQVELILTPSNYGSKHFWIAGKFYSLFYHKLSFVHHKHFQVSFKSFKVSNPSNYASPEADSLHELNLGAFKFEVTGKHKPHKGQTQADKGISSRNHAKKNQQPNTKARMSLETRTIFLKNLRGHFIEKLKTMFHDELVRLDSMTFLKELAEEQLFIIEFIELEAKQEKTHYTKTFLMTLALSREPQECTELTSFGFGVTSFQATKMASESILRLIFLILNSK